MKAQQYREMSPDELGIKLEELEKHLFDLSSQSVTEKIEDSKAIRNTKREIARIKTVIRQMRK
jgi:large subunit ribosomal protein L29